MKYRASPNTLQEIARRFIFPGSYRLCNALRLHLPTDLHHAFSTREARTHHDAVGALSSKDERVAARGLGCGTQLGSTALPFPSSLSPAAAFPQTAL
jgi:hypothetical protein